ncbi:DHS-like NAD/FAD-binding domain-containing protein [Rhizoclosmatium globosum]|uniref:DHS-like NAD/FAD-binding domain-containing protein n=1 Tax=Rhizoclosmatium globosum TaxID=329046 RepID=A0A1Y2B6N8_9FUNG|nr:DHS-like NAD/FAD-binding domain-containing protein [Rhizoclosmatium globosum]|eukprot:ORY30503.1 DHS-like NAD/FAD-binding domain-containing protein [Rhizoclosmatium globosum]
MVHVLATADLLGTGTGTDTSATNEERRHFSLIAGALRRAKKVVAVAGAGISVSAGIPDFRSADGLYNLVKNKYPQSVVKGKDMFDASLFRDPTSTQIFYSFIAELKVLSDAASLTKTHYFLKTLNDRGQLLRCYTQNIDCLESRLDLSPRATSTPSSSSTPSTPVKRAPPKPLPTLVHLHGALDTLICTLCKQTVPFSEPLLQTCQTGTAPACIACTTNSAVRSALGKRAIACGVLRPNIILYGEHHASGADISKTVGVDIRRRPDVLLVMGTSLKVDGVKSLVKNLAKAVHEGGAGSSANSGGIVVLLNRTRLGKEWDAVFDYQLLGDVDDCVELLENEMESMAVASSKRRVGTASPTSSGGLVQTKLTSMMKAVKSDVVVAAPVKSVDPPVPSSSSASSSSSLGIQKEVTSGKGEPLGDDQENDEPKPRTSTRIGRTAAAPAPSATTPKKPIAIKSAIKKPLKPTTQSSTTTIKPKTLANTIPSSLSIATRSSAPPTNSKPSTPQKKASRSDLACTIVEAKTPTTFGKTLMAAVDTPSKYLEGLSLRADSSADSEVLLDASVDLVRTSSAVRKDNEGSPTKKVKGKGGEEVLLDVLV